VGGVLKVVQIGHESVTLSGDGTAWFSDPENWRECEKRYAWRREQAFIELRRDIAGIGLIGENIGSSPQSQNATEKAR
jgi:hypothetical protein